MGQYDNGQSPQVFIFNGEAKTMKLYELLAEPPRGMSLRQIYSEHPLPTEFVTSEAKICVPRMARCYFTNLVRVDGEIKEYSNGLLASRKVLETVSLWEIWEDSGSDGHTEYRLRGWAYIDESSIEKELKDCGWPKPRALAAADIVMSLESNWRQ